MRTLCFLICCAFSWSLQAKTLVVGLSAADYPPYYYATDDGYEGAAVTVAEKVAAQIGYQLEYRRYPWKRVQQNLKTGAIDMVLVYLKSPDRAESVIYSTQPFVTETASLFVSNNMQVDFTGDLESLTDYPLFGVRGYFYGEAYQALPEHRKQSVRDESELVRRITNPNLDLIGVGHRPAIEYYARRQGLENRLTFLTPYIFEGDNYFAFSRAAPEAETLARRFSEKLNAFMQTPAYKKLLAQYGLHAPKPR